MEESGVTRLGSVLLLSFGLVACSSGGSAQQSGTTRSITPEDTSRGIDRREKVDVGDDSRRASLVTVYFDYDEARLRPDAKDSLRQNAEYLRTVQSAVVELQGNCDERGTEEYNLALGKRRAESAKQYLADLGIVPRRMTTVSFGEENPAVQGRTESAWARNRRVDFVLR